jgi:hypothetical protein
MSPTTWTEWLAWAENKPHKQIGRYSCSQLDDLYLCPHLERERGDMSAAWRGTALHALVQLRPADWPLDLPEAEEKALREAQAHVESLCLTCIRHDVELGGGLLDFGGTADMVGVLPDGDDIVIDFKFGARTVMPDCLQLLAYAYLYSAKQTAIIQGAKLRVCSPNLTDYDRLRAALATIRAGDLRTGSHCHKCAKREECSAYACYRSDAIERVQSIESFGAQPVEITIPDDPERCAAILDSFRAAETVIEAVRDKIKADMIAGTRQVAGYQVVRGKRQTTAWKRLAEERCTPDEINHATTITETVTLKRASKRKEA